MKAFHLTKDTLRDGRLLPAIGEWLVHEGDVEICATGLHASVNLIDALRYCPRGAKWIHVVECEDVVTEHGDKFVCRRRRIVSTHAFDFAKVVRLACECAALGAWGRPWLDNLVTAALAADEKDWERARKEARSADAAYAADAYAADAYAAYAAADAADAAYAAAADAAYAAAADAAYAAAAYAAYAAADAADAAYAAYADAARSSTRAQCEARARELLLGAP